MLFFKPIIKHVGLVAIALLLRLSRDIRAYFCQLFFGFVCYLWLIHLP